jgi:calcineurin-like phosphoesterase family protein
MRDPQSREEISKFSKSTRMVIMRYWLTTDTHFGHEKLIEVFGRPENFVALILDRMERTIKPEDVLIHLGDFCVTGDEKWHKLFREVVPGKHWLVLGNHDKKSDTWYLERGWDFVGKRIWLEKFGKKMLFSHKPIADCGYDINVHGHFHDRRLDECEPELTTILTPKHVCLALEWTNYFPVHLQSLVEDFNTRLSYSG